MRVADVVKGLVTPWTCPECSAGILTDRRGEVMSKKAVSTGGDHCQTA